MRQGKVYRSAIHSKANRMYDTKRAADEGGYIAPDSRGAGLCVGGVTARPGARAFAAVVLWQVFIASRLFRNPV